MYYEKNESMIGRKVADELLLVPTKQNITDLQCIYTLNEIGSRIWELINGGTSLETIVTTLTKEYKVDIKRAEADVNEFLKHLEEIGAVTLINGGNQLEV